MAKRLAEKINGAPVEALKNDYVDYLNRFDFSISRYKKSPFDEEYMVGKEKYFLNYNLFPFRHCRNLSIGKWIEITAIEKEGCFKYSETEIGDTWRL